MLILFYSRYCFFLCLSTYQHVVHYKEPEGVEVSDAPPDRAQRAPEVSAEPVVLPAVDGADPGHMGVTL